MGRKTQQVDGTKKLAPGHFPKLHQGDVIQMTDAELEYLLLDSGLPWVPNMPSGPE